MNAYFMSSALAILLGLGLSVFVFFSNKKALINQIFACFLLCMVVWIFGDVFFLTPLIYWLTPLFWFKLIYIGPTFTPALYYHFATTFTKTPTKKRTLIFHYVASCIYLAANLFSPLFFKSVTYIPGSNYINFEAGIIYYIFIVHALLATVSGVGFAIYRFRSSTGQIREQMKYFLSATVLMVIATLLFATMITTNTTIRLDNLFMIFYAGIVAYSFTKKRLMDISVVIGRTMAVVLTTLTYCTLYVIMMYLYLYYVSPQIGIGLAFLSCIFLIITGMTFEKLKTGMITTSQKLFVRGKYNYRQTLLKITSELQTIASVSDFILTIQKNFLDDIEVSTTHLFLPQEFENRKDISNTLIAYSKNTATELTEFDISTCQALQLHSPENTVIFMKELDLQISQSLTKHKIFASIATYTTDNHLLCIILIGKKLTEETFNSDDYDLFSSLAAQIPAHLIRIQATRVAAEMDVAQRIQTDILPKNPTLPKLELACFMAPADEVGGDYYDVYHINDTSWIILGDVAGHGVASGLVMFMVQSIVTTLLQSHNTMTPGELNYLANIILCKNFERTAEARPMTLVTLSSTDGRTFQMDGSHDGIYIYRAATKEVETHRVDHFPFGIGFVSDLEKELFINEIFTLETDDVLFLCTDGISEAYKNGNPKEEQFGDDRLLSFISENAHLNPTIVQEKLLADINAFTNHIYVDDITFLVIKAV